MEPEETFSEHAPVTPAHKFAWRAFKGFVYGSPESPENMGKENTYPLRVSSQKRVNLDMPSLSPQKRKRDTQVSPTKSILRTPGAPTPRTKSLRDVNVKFKSISPEVQKTLSASVPVTVTLEKEVDNLWQELEHSLDVTKSLAAKKEGQKIAHQVSLPALALPFPIAADAERDAYARRTEKEVKRLLRQHKKLRDYARRADEQNVVLQSIVDDLRAENARLKTNLERQDRALEEQRKISLTAPDQISDQRVRKGDQDGIQSLYSDKATHERKVAGGLSRTEAFMRSLRGEDPGLDIVRVREAGGLPDRTKSVSSSQFLSSKEPTKSGSAIMRPDTSPGHKDRRDEDEVISQLPPAAFPSQLTNRASTTPQAQPLHQPQGHRKQAVDASQDALRNKSSPLSLTGLAAQLEPTPTQLGTFSGNAISSISSKANEIRQHQRASLPTAAFANKDPSCFSSNRAVSLTADRVAAARQRLARKKEERGLGNATSLAFVTGEMEPFRLVPRKNGTREASDRKQRGEGVSRAGVQGEESAVDWAGL